MWNNFHGIVPKGFHIHHKDENKSNNNIENLDILSVSNHVRVHITEERIERSKKHMEKIRPLTKKWHGSEEGKTWHKFNALKCKFGKNEPIDYVCVRCSKKFKSSKLSNTKFCTNACKSAHRRASGLDDIKRECQNCGIEFTKNKYSKIKFCSRSCAVKHQHKS